VKIRTSVLFVALATWTVLPMALLVMLSVGRTWFFPALLPSGWTGETWAALVGDGRLGDALGNSVLLALPVGLIAACIGWPVGRLLARSQPITRHVGAALAFLPVAAPPVALATGLQWSFLRVGLGGSVLGVALAHAVPAAGYASLYMLGVFTGRDDRAEDEARTLGAAPWQVRMRITLPSLRRPLAEAWLLGFLVSWAQLPLTLLVGGGLVTTLPLEVFAYMQAGQDRFAATGALLLSLPPLLAIAAVRVAAGRTQALPV
jgi:putative spermidine/putrescine transport system permease protein